MVNRYRKFKVQDCIRVVRRSKYDSIVPDKTHSYRPTALSEISKGLWENITTHYLSYDMVFTNTVVRSTGQSGAKTKYGVRTVRGQ